MEKLKGACIIMQSGRPTAAINASLLGVINEARKNDSITKIYGSANSMKGLIEEKLFDISKDDESVLQLLRYTPSCALGSSRYLMDEPEVNDSDYKKMLKVIRLYPCQIYL